MLASSRNPRAAANAPGGYRIRPYMAFLAPETRGFSGICGTYKTTVGRDALIPPHPALLRTPRADMESAPTWCSSRRKHAAFPVCETYKMTVGRDALIPPHPAPPQTPAGGINPSPTNQRRARGQPGKRKPCAMTNPCRGRCSHRPGNPAIPQTPAGGINPSPTNQRRARGQPGNRKPCAITNPCRGRCSHRPGYPATPQTPRADIESAPTMGFPRRKHAAFPVYAEPIKRP